MSWRPPVLLVSLSTCSSLILDTLPVSCVSICKFFRLSIFLREVWVSPLPLSIASTGRGTSSPTLTSSSPAAFLNSSTGMKVSCLPVSIRTYLSVILRTLPVSCVSICKFLRLSIFSQEVWASPLPLSIASRTTGTSSPTLTSSSPAA